MRVLNLSLDRAVLDENSPVAKRIAALSAAVGEVVVLTPFFYRGGKVAQFFGLWKQAKKVLREKQFNLITVQDTAYLALLAYLLARKFRIPFEVQVHGFEKMRGIRKLLARFMLRRADKIRVVSERLKQSLTSNFQLSTTKLYVLPVYTQINPPLPPFSKGGNRGDFVFLTVGRLVPVKNVALQIRAFARIAKEFPSARLVIVGDGPLAENLKCKVKSLKLADRIQFFGQQKNLVEFYKESDAFLLTSDSEGWGVAVTEAASYGVPIIMTDVGCAGEFIKSGENGIVIPVRDEEALVSAMKTIIVDAELRARLGEAAQKAFLSLPTIEKQIEKQVTEWRRML